jgi:U3 small nucleolar RNA-associated protein 22
MAPAIKRRKLQHDDSEASDGSAKDSATTQRKEGTLPKTSAVANPHRRPDAQLQDGAYTAESFKSNVFKLQIDELLEQVTPKYGKREAPAENAMRVLKSVIEELPSRSPLSASRSLRIYALKY